MYNCEGAREKGPIAVILNQEEWALKVWRLFPRILYCALNVSRPSIERATANH